jgi:chromate reductase
MSHIVTLAASFRDDSNNQKLVDMAAEIAEAQGARITRLSYPVLDCPLLKDNGTLPDMPDGALRLAQAMRDADGLFIATPEFNWSMPGSLKNLIDWLSLDATYPLKGKTALLMSASPSLRGGIMGLDHLRTTLSLMGMHIHPQLVGIGNAHNIIQDGTITSAKEQEFLHQCVCEAVRTTNQLTA